MSINNLNTYLNVRDAHLRVVSGNVYAQAMNIGGINVETAHGLQSVSNTGNATSLTLEFANVTTGFVTTANAQIGRDLVVTGNATVSKELTVTSNAIVSSNLNVSDDLVVTNNILASNNLTVTGNLNVTTVMSDSNVVTEYTGPHDRPLRKYPEVAMTSASQGGYVVTPSTQNGVNVAAYNMFDGDRSTRWRPNAINDTYDAFSPFIYNGIRASSISDTSGTTHDGVFLKLELPKAIKLDYTIIRENSDPASGTPGKITFLGSTNGTDWTFLKEFSGMTSTALDETYTINDTNYYNHFAFVVKNLSDASGELTLGEWELYGYEEGSGSLDTTLKTVYNVPPTTGTQLEVYYDGQDYSADTDFDQANEVLDKSGNNLHGSQTGGVGFDSTYKAFTFDGSGDSISRVITNSQGAYVHSWSTWVKLDTLSGQILWHLGLDGTGGTNGSDTSSVYIEPDGSLSWFWWSNDVKFSNQKLITGTWYHLAGSYNGGAPISSRKLWINGIEQVISSTAGSQLGTALGLEVNTTLRLGTRYQGGGFLDGSIANFRLYSKALNAGQVQELYDYQKDYFLGSKSQVTLYKGHLGVGVTEPSGQLELAGDERLQEYPPGPMTNHSTYIEGHGVFTAWGTNQSGIWPEYQAFDDTTNVWYSDSLGEYDNRDYTGSQRLAAETPKGAFVVLEMPYEIVIKQTAFTQQTNGAHVWDRGIYYAKRNPSDEWTAIHNVTDRPADDATPYVAYITDPRPYKYFAIVITRRYATTTSSGGVSIQNFRIFGTPGPTTLDKGSLTLGRSLDVPRVSRYDVDTETPRPEKLVVDFDTTHDNNAADISRNGNGGIFENNLASYSAAEKAFNFDGNNGVILTGPLSPAMTGDKICSMSAWFKTTNASTVNQSIMWLGAYSVAGLLMVAVSNGTLRISIGSGCSLDVAGVIESNTWYHVVGIKQGTGSITSSNFSSTFKLYLNGEPVTGTFGGTARTLNVTTNYWYVGAGNSTGAEAFSGYISNPKLYDTVLEPSEIKKLYNLGRIGRSMVISDTSVGIGKAPETQLDVRGSAAIAGYLGIGTKPGDSFGGALHVASRHGEGVANASSRRYFRYDVGLSASAGGARGSIYGRWDIISSSYFISTAGTASASDERIKKNIIDVDDSSALDTLRLLKPKKYQYRDTVVRGTEHVWGFIAQEVRDTLPYATHERSDFVPNIYQLADVSDSNVITFSEFNTSELEDSTILKVISSTDEEHEVRIIETIDDTTIRVNTNLDAWTGSVDDEGNVVSGNKIFVYGQKVDDFIFVKKDSIWTIATAALQEIDRQLQAESAHKDALEARIETNIQELRAENTRLKNKVAILENRQTHFNTLLVNLTGRIETLERGA